MSAFSRHLLYKSNWLLKTGGLKQAMSKGAVFQDTMLYD
jgi:hypothetical protein